MALVFNRFFTTTLSLIACRTHTYMLFDVRQILCLVVFYKARNILLRVIEIRRQNDTDSTPVERAIRTNTHTQASNQNFFCSKSMLCTWIAVANVSSAANTQKHTWFFSFISSLRLQPVNTATHNIAAPFLLWANYCGFARCQKCLLCGKVSRVTENRKKERESNQKLAH